MLNVDIKYNFGFPPNYLKYSQIGKIAYANRHIICSKWSVVDNESRPLSSKKKESPTPIATQAEELLYEVLYEVDHFARNGSRRCPVKLDTT